MLACKGIFAPRFNGRGIEDAARTARQSYAVRFPAYIIPNSARKINRDRTKKREQHQKVSFPLSVTI